MRHHPPRKHPAKRQQHSDAVNEAERRALWGIDFSQEPTPQPPDKVKIRPGRPKKKKARPV